MPSSSSSENPGSDVVINDDNFKQFEESSSSDDREKSRISVSPVEDRPCSSAQADEEHGKRLKLLLMQRSYSLQSALKVPGSQRSLGKSVRFADTEGESLTRIRHLSADYSLSTEIFAPNNSKFAIENFSSQIGGQIDKKPMNPTIVGDREDKMSPSDRTIDSLPEASGEPSTSRDVRLRLHRFETRGMLMTGAVRVMTCTPSSRRKITHEQVYLCLSMDNWKTYEYVVAFRQNESGAKDLFVEWTFCARLKAMRYGERCQFTIHYYSDREMIVDNNGGQGYQLEFHVPERPVHLSRESLLSDLLGLNRMMIY